jgi:hypothetical protein
VESDVMLRKGDDDRNNQGRAEDELLGEPPRRLGGTKKH